MTQYTVRMYDEQTIEYDEYDGPDDLPEATETRRYDTLKDALNDIMVWVPSDDFSNIEHRFIEANTIGFYEPGQPWDCLLIRGDTIEDKPDDAGDGDPPFGEATAVTAHSSVSVKRPLNDYSKLTEVFEFTVSEPAVDAADRDGTICWVTYSITHGQNKSRHGIEDPEYQTHRIPVTDVPTDVVDRAKAMLDHVEWPDELDNEEGDNE